MCGGRVKDTQWSYGKKWCVPVELPSHPGCRWHMDSPNQSTHSSTHGEESQACTGSTGVGICWDNWNIHTHHKGSLTSNVMVDLGSFLCQSYFIMSWDLTSLVLLSPKRPKFSSGIPDGSFWLFCTRTDCRCLKSKQVWGQHRSMDPINCNCTCEVSMSMTASPAFEGKWHSTACICLTNLPSPTAEVWIHTVYWVYM